MSLFVDTSVWSLAFRRDHPRPEPQVAALHQALSLGQPVLNTGLVLQELLQGLQRPRQRDALVERFRSLPLVIPDRADHVSAAELRNACRRRGVQVGTIDALLAQLCVRHELTMLSTDRDFERLAAHSELELWRG